MKKMNLRKFASCLLASALTLGSLTACGGEKTADSPAPSASTETSESPSVTPTEDVAPESTMTIDELKPLLKTVSDGKLTCATSPDFAPYEFYAIDENKEPHIAGFDVALAGYIADYLGLELELVPMDFDGVLEDLKTKSADIGMAGLSPDPDRMDIMDFSDIYYFGGQSFICLESTKDKFPDLAATNNSSYQIGAQTGSIQVNLAQDNSPDADLIQLAKVTDIIAEVLTGKLDGAYVETAVAESYKLNYPDLCVALEVPYDVSGSSVGVQKGNPALLAAVNLAVNAAVSDGSMDKFVAEANEQATGEVFEGVLE